MRIRQLRQAKKMSQRDLAEKAGLSREYVLRLEGAQQNPTLGTLEKIAKALRVPVGELVK